MCTAIINANVYACAQKVMSADRLKTNYMNKTWKMVFSSSPCFSNAHYFGWLCLCLSLSPSLSFFYFPYVSLLFPMFLVLTFVQSHLAQGHTLENLAKYSTFTGKLKKKNNGNDFKIGKNFLNVLFCLLFCLLKCC